MIVWKQLCLIEKDKKSWQETIEKIDTATISASLAHYIFRDGPVEDMHSDGKLSETDMETLNKYMNDRLATVIHLLKEHDWMRLIMLIEMKGFAYSAWDDPNLCVEEIDRLSAEIYSIYKAKERPKL